MLTGYDGRAPKNLLHRVAAFNNLKPALTGGYSQRLFWRFADTKNIVLYYGN
jgi:hypothetical protein